MPVELVRFWEKYKSTSAPFVHPDDLPVLKDGKFADIEATDLDRYLAHPRFGDFADPRFHLSLLPTPYGGDLRNADIVILLLNPGFNIVDYYAVRDAEFRDRVETSLRQDFGSNDFPFYFLDPRLCWHSGFMWWEKKLRAVISEVAARKHNGHYFEALKDISRRLAFVELVPYHSPVFNAHALLNRLPSVQAVRNYVQGRLLPAAVAGEKTIIVTRQAAVWNLPTSNPNIIIYSGGMTRGASLGPETPGGIAILRRYGLR